MTPAVQTGRGCRTKYLISCFDGKLKVSFEKSILMFFSNENIVVSDKCEYNDNSIVNPTV